MVSESVAFSHVVGTTGELHIEKSMQPTIALPSTGNIFRGVIMWF
jgi:hypothetical protein